MKYVITDQKAINIGDNTHHNILADTLPGKVIAAGHCIFNGITWKVWGRSTTFNLNAQPIDALRLAQLYGTPTTYFLSLTKQPNRWHKKKTLQ